MIGWQHSTTQYASHYASGDSDSNETVCMNQTSYFTTLVYRIDSGQSPPLHTYTFLSVDVGIRQKICSRILHDVA